MAGENNRRHPHLFLPRAEVELERKLGRSFGIPPKPFSEHGSRIHKQVDSVLQQFQSRASQRPSGIDSKLLLRVHLERTGAIPDDEWRKNGLTLVSEDRDGITVLLASDSELKNFRRRLREYQHGPSPDQKSAPHASLIDAIKEVWEYGPEDRKGRLIREITIEAEKEYALDLELWHSGDNNIVRGTLSQVEKFIEQKGGKVLDRYVGASVCLARVFVRGDVIDQLLQLEPVAKLDLPPKPALTVAEALQLTIEDFPPITKPSIESPRVCIIDSGIANGHPMLAPAVGESIPVPSSLGTAIDEHGHGTCVAGLALYNDISECITNRQFSPSLWVLSAKVTQIENTPFGPQMKFPDDRLIPTQMREAIEYFHREHGCRVFNISLGDERLIYEGGKPSIWAWTLDDIARKLDVIIVVSAGNSSPDLYDDKHKPEDVINEYPKYLLRKKNRIIEPATAAIPITVGSLAHSDAPRESGGRDDIALKAIARKNQPSPFTRSGFGIGEAIKPELCEYGGNLVFDYRLKRLWDKNPGVEVISLHHGHVTGRLFAWDRGTSFAAPKVAHCATQILSLFPRASANLIRAFLASSASIPEEAKSILESLGNDASYKICGYGRPDRSLAAYSFDHRVTLFAENELLADHFHVYEVLLPDIFRNTKGKRNISVTLAFDPPTRHTRKDYLGFTMKFYLIRGKNFEQVKSIFRKSKPSDEKIKGISGTRFECKLQPGHQIREKGTLQKGVFPIGNNPDEEYGDTYYLIVQCAKNWTDEEKQRYAVVVVMEHKGLEARAVETITLYQAIQERIEERERIRIRP